MGLSGPIVIAELQGGGRGAWAGNQHPASGGVTPRLLFDNRDI